MAYNKANNNRGGEAAWTAMRVRETVLCLNRPLRLALPPDRAEAASLPEIYDSAVSLFTPPDRVRF